MRVLVLVIVAMIGVGVLACGGCFTLIASLPKPTPQQQAANKATSDELGLRVRGERLTREYISKFLKAPKDAEFSDVTVKAIDTQVVFVTGDVTAQNSFGARLTNPFQAMYWNQDDKMDLAELHLAGEVKYKDKPLAAKCHAYARSKK